MSGGGLRVCVLLSHPLLLDLAQCFHLFREVFKSTVFVKAQKHNHSAPGKRVLLVTVISGSVQ